MSQSPQEKLDVNPDEEMGVIREQEDVVVDEDSQVAVQSPEPEDLSLKGVKSHYGDLTVDWNSENKQLRIIHKTLWTICGEYLYSHGKSAWEDPAGYIAKWLLGTILSISMLYLLSTTAMTTYFQFQNNNIFEKLPTTDSTYGVVSSYVIVVGIATALICASFFSEDTIRDDIQQIWGKLEDLIGTEEDPLPQIHAKVYDSTGLLMVLSGLVLIVVGAVLWATNQIVAGLFILCLSITFLCLVGVLRVINVFRRTDYLMVITMKKIVKRYLNRKEETNPRVVNLLDRLEKERTRAVDNSKNGFGEQLDCRD